MKKMLILLLLVVFLLTLPGAERLGILTEIVQPSAMEVGGGKLYVVQGTEFYVYSLAGLNFIKKFGSAGEGPGELKNSPLLPNSIKIMGEMIIAEGISKIIFFSKDFQPLRDVKKPRMMFTLLPVKNNFLALQFLPDRGDKIFLTLTLFDEKMNAIKELHRQGTLDRDKEIIMLRDTIHYAIYGDHIYIERSDRGFNIGIYDSEGNFISQIEKKFKQQKLTQSDKNKIFQRLKSDRLIQTIAKGNGGWQNFVKLTTFTYPDTFPPIKDITVADGKIYVSTFENQNGKEKHIIMDLKGNVLGTTFLPEPLQPYFTASSLGRDNRFYAIYKDTFYYLQENPATEEWELHMKSIK